MFKNIKNYPQNKQKVSNSRKKNVKLRKSQKVMQSNLLEPTWLITSLTAKHMTNARSLKSSLKLLKFWTLKQDMLEISRKRMLQVEIPPNSPKMRCGYGEAATQRSARPKNGGPVLMDEVQVGGPRGTWVLVLRPPGYESIPINTIFNGMNIHLPAILGFTRYQGFDPSPPECSRVTCHQCGAVDDEFFLELRSLHAVHFSDVGQKFQGPAHFAASFAKIVTHSHSM